MEDGERADDPPGETLEQRVTRIIRFELSELPVAQAIMDGHDITGTNVPERDMIAFSLAYGNGLQEALLDLARQLDKRLGPLDT